MRHSTVRSFDNVAWRAPTAQRFDGRPANVEEPMPSLMDELRGLPRAVYAVGGGLVAAVMGALLGGAMHI